MKSYVRLAPGDPAPWFSQRSPSNPNYKFDTAAGRYILLCFFGSAGDAHGKAALQAVRANRALFDDTNLCFFGVSIDPADERDGRVQQSLPGIRFFWDFDRSVSRKYGVVAQETDDTDPRVEASPRWMILDPALRILDVLPLVADGGKSAVVFDRLRQLLAGRQARASQPSAPVPVLWLPNVFEPELCRMLIGVYDQQGGEESGFMRDVGGQTTELHNPDHKRRKDCTISDAQLIQSIQRRVQRRIAPEILKVHHFKATRMERYIVSCYSAEDRGHFRAHRDNTTSGTAHRRFAVSINLNDEFDGGTISFPEYGSQGFRMPVGGAVVFSCSLLHAVEPVTRGRRFAFLPFLYDEAAARIRQENHHFLGEGYGDYKA